MDHLKINLRLANHMPHPRNPDYVVFMFYKQNMANYFENKLLEESIYFEKDIEKDRNPVRYLFAVKKNRFETVLPFNFEAHAKYRKPLFGSRLGSWLAVLFLLGLIGMLLYAHYNH